MVVREVGCREILRFSESASNKNRVAGPKGWFERDMRGGGQPNVIELKEESQSAKAGNSFLLDVSPYKSNGECKTDVQSTETTSGLRKTQAGRGEMKLTGTKTWFNHSASLAAAAGR
jgi:hypothetical protein